MSDCIEWTGSRDKYGYGHKWANSRWALVHRHVWEMEHGPIPQGMFVLHSCDNPPCYRIDHLRLGTHADNMQDKITRDRQSKGASHGRAKLTEDQVREIFVSSETQRELAQKYGVSQTTIHFIKSGRNWSHITQGAR